MNSVLGIDVGGAKTLAVLADEQGTVISTSLRAAGANLQTAGPLGLQQVLRAAIDEALAGRAVTPAAICLGVSGMDRPDDEAVVRQVVGDLGFTGRILVVNDALIALVAGIGDAPGVVIVAGTGSMAYGRNAKDEAARSGGWGHVLGDEGSGYWIGNHALTAVMQAADGRGPATKLTPMVLAHFGVERAGDLVRKVYHEHLSFSAIASLAPFVQQAHDAGDELATIMLADAASELIRAARAVVDQLLLRDEAFTFVLSGGVFRGLPWLRERMTQSLPAVASKSTTIHLQRQPALGAVRLAIAELQAGARVPRYKTGRR